MAEKSNHPWIERVRQADGDAEVMWNQLIQHYKGQPAEQVIGSCLAIIAAELRAQRIARRPGVGQ